MTDHINRNPEAIARVLGDELPPLPESEPFADGKVFTEEQLREYARAAIAPYKLANAQFDKRCRVLDEKLFDAEARVAELEETQRKFGIVQHEILRRAEEAEAEIARLNAERATFYMDYRMKCDADIKDLHAEVERLRELLRESRSEVEYWTPDESTATTDESEALNGWYELRDRIDAALKEKP